MRGAADAIGHGLAGRELPFVLRFVELPAGQRVDVGPATLRSFPCNTSPIRVRTDCTSSRAGAASSTAATPAGSTTCPRHTRGADLFVCECTFHEPVIPEHMAYDELVERVPRLGCERMVLTHLGTSMAERRGKLEVETADDGLLKIEV